VERNGRLPLAEKDMLCEIDQMRGCFKNFLDWSIVVNLEEGETKHSSRPRGKLSFIIYIQVWPVVPPPRGATIIKAAAALQIGQLRSRSKTGQALSNQRRSADSP
jgi:hypothetical protein